MQRETIGVDRSDEWGMHARQIAHVDERLGDHGRLEWPTDDRRCLATTFLARHLHDAVAHRRRLHRLGLLVAQLVRSLQI